jgi:hypothetical protein
VRDTQESLWPLIWVRHPEGHVHNAEIEGKAADAFQRVIAIGHIEDRMPVCLHCYCQDHTDEGVVIGDY